MIDASDVRAIVKHHWRTDQGKMLVAIALGWFFALGMRLAYPMLLPFLREAHGLSLSAIGLLLSILWIAYAIGQLPGGVLADRLGERIVLVGSMLISAGTLGLIVVGGSPSVVFLATALFGFGTALYGIVRLTILSAIYPDDVGTAIGLVSATGDVGNVVMPPVAGLVAGAIAWQLGFGFAIPCFLVLAIIYWRALPSRAAEPRAEGDGLTIDRYTYILSTLRASPIVLITSVQILGNIIWQALTGFYPTYLIEVKGLSPTFASGLFALFFALGAIIRPIAGRVYDSRGPRRSLVVVMSVAGAGLLVLPFVDEIWLLVPVTMLMSAILGRGTIVLSFLAAELPVDARNTGLGVLRTIYMVIGATSPALFGLFADAEYFDEGFLVLGAIAGLTLILIRWLPEDRSTD